MKYLSYTCLCFFMMSMLACEKELPFPEQNIQSKLVINSTFSADSTWNVHVSKSIPISQSGNPENIENATLVIKDDNDAIVATLAHQENGFYTANSNPESGKSYTIEASASGYDAIKAKSYQPKSFSYEIQDTTRSTYLDVPVMFIDLEIEDNADEENYYLIEVSQIILYEQDSLIQTTNTGHYVFDQNTENDDITADNIGHDKVYLPDFAFNGEKYTTRLAVNIFDFGFFQESKILGLLVSVSSVSSELYKYTKTLEQYYFNNDGLFSEPVEIFNNIENGLGVFGGHSTKEEFIEF